jgi:hypothetical protein
MLNRERFGVNHKRPVSVTRFYGSRPFESADRTVLVEETTRLVHADLAGCGPLSDMRVRIRRVKSLP